MKKEQILVLVIVWTVLIGIGTGIWMLVISPVVAKNQEEAAKKEELQIIHQTSADSKYKINLNFALDSFSGYSIFRSEQFVEELANKRIKLNLVDDGADYKKRFALLENDEVQIAAFTVDALIKQSQKHCPVVIIGVIDETRGADAIVAYKTAIKNVDDLNSADVKFVLTMDSPSETLTRVVQTYFGLNNTNSNSFIQALNAEDVYQNYRSSKPDEKKAFVLWEPYVSKMLENPNTHVITNSSKFNGYMVDVIVANRDFLAKNRDICDDFMKAYFSALYFHRENMTQLILDDAKKTGTTLNQKQAEALVNGVVWRNTQENFIQFGLQKGKLQHIEDIIINLTNVLKKTKGIKNDPTNGSPNMLYYPEILGDLASSNFHPGSEIIREENLIPSLTDHQWSILTPVGTLDIPQLVFARGSDVLTDQAKVVLNDLVTSLNACPQYYLTIKGNAAKTGNLEANKKLAYKRAKSAEKYLLERGIEPNRVKAIGVEPAGTTSVVFILGQMPY